MPNPNPGSLRFKNLTWLLLSLLVIGLDQWTKHLAVTHLEYASPVAVLPSLNWTLLHNYGAAFSFLADSGGWQRVLFSLIAVGFSVVLSVWLVKIPVKRVVLPVALALIIGGAIGNLIDRVSLGYVVDFIHVYYQNWHYPAFNLADSAIVGGALLMLFDSFFLNPEPKKDAS